MMIFAPERCGTRVAIKLLEGCTGSRVRYENEARAKHYNIIFIRDFRDLVTSWWRVNLFKANKAEEYTKRQMNEAEMMNILNNQAIIAQWNDSLENTANDILRYEDWYNDYDKVFDLFPDMKEEKKQELRDEWSVTAVRDKLSKVNRDWDRSTGMFKEHISPKNGQPGQWEEKIPRILHGILYENIDKYLIHWNYK